jgi:DNA-binding response OmpR family regulator
MWTALAPGARAVRAVRARDRMGGGCRVLIVGHDAVLRRSLSEQLELNAEFSGVECDNAAAALRAVRGQRFDAVLLDAGLPDMPGSALCRRMRRAGVAAPIIVITAEGESDIALALDAGADDCVAKPLRVADLLARLRAHLSRGEGGDDPVLTIGPYAFRPDAKLLSEANGRRKVRLTDKETAILTFLYRAGRAIGRDTLLGEVWGYNAAATTHTVETHVYRLRRKIERDPANAEILVTEPGGYRLLP